MVLEIKTNPAISPELYPYIEAALVYMYGVGFDAGREVFLEDQISHPVAIVTPSGKVLREFPSLKAAIRHTKDTKVTIINAIKYNRKTRRGFRYKYTGERKNYKSKDTK